MGDNNQNTDSIRGAIPLIASLGDVPTDPVDSVDSSLPPINFEQMSKELQEFILTDSAPNLYRGLPYVDRIVYNTGLSMLHIWIHLKVPIRNVTQATESLIRGELEKFADQIESYFDKDFAISVRLN